MKYLSFILFSLVGHFAIAQTTPVQPTTPVAVPATVQPAAEPVIPATTIEWLESEFKFGTIKQGDKVEHVFKFKNTGNNPLVIKSAKGSCGCTVPEYSKDPLPPGKVGEMKVIFNSAGKMGQQSKPVTVIANTDPEQTRVTLNGMVEQPAGTPAPPTEAMKPVAPPAAPATVDHDHKHPHAEANVNAKPVPTSMGKSVTKAATKTEKVVKSTTADAAKMTKEAEKAAKKAEKAAKKAEKAAKKAEKAAKKAKKAAEKAAKAK